MMRNSVMRNSMMRNSVMRNSVKNMWGDLTRRLGELFFYLASGWRATAWFAFCVAVGVAYMVSALLPYSPLSVHSIEVIPSEVCPEQGVEVFVDRELRDGLVYAVGSVEVSSRWRNVDTGERYPTVSATVSPELEVSDGRVRSDLIRVAVSDPGEYRIDTRYDIERGRAGIAPAYQRTGWIASENTVRVMECG